jgi:hypothetical protein
MFRQAGVCTPLDALYTTLATSYTWVRVLRCVIVRSVRILFPSAHYSAELDMLAEPRNNKLMTSITRNTKYPRPMKREAPNSKGYSTSLTFTNSQVVLILTSKLVPDVCIVQRDVLTFVMFH